MKNDTKFTPGPWAHFDSPAARDIFNGCSVIISHHIDDAVIATIGEDVPNHEGNARLIAAAPEMYERLERLLETCSCTCTFPSDECCPVSAARAVLVKAAK